MLLTALCGLTLWAVGLVSCEEESQALVTVDRSIRGEDYFNRYGFLRHIFRTEWMVTAAIIWQMWTFLSTYLFYALAVTRTKSSKSTDEGYYNYYPQYQYR